MNSDKISIPHKRHFESTMFLFRHAEIHEQYYGSSTDPEVKATAGRPAAICHLLFGISAPCRLCAHRE